MRFVPVGVALLLALVASPASAVWLPGGNVVSPTPALDEAFLRSPADACTDGAGGFVTAFVSEVWHPGIGYANSRLLATRLTANGELASGWPIGAVNLATWHPEDPIASYYEGRSIVPDGLGGAHLLTRLSGLTAGGYLERMRRFHLHADGSFSAVPADPFEALLVRDHKAVADGAGGVVIAGIQITTAPPLETPPPAYLFVRREDAAGAPLWTPSPGAPGVALALASDVAAGGGLDALQVLGDDAGGCWVTHLGVVASEYDLRVERVLGDGSIPAGWPAGGMRPAIATAYEFESRLARGPGGSVYVAWNDGREYRVNGAGLVFLTRIEPDGSRSPGWPDGGLRLGSGTAPHRIVALAPDGAGGVFAARATLVGPPEVSDIWAFRLHHVGADGQTWPGWPAGGIPITAGWSTAKQAALVDDGLGGVFVAYTDYEGLFAKHLNADGTPGIGLPAAGALLSADGLLPSIVRSGDDAIVTWQAAPEGSAAYQVFAQRLLHGGLVAVGDESPIAPSRLALVRIAPNPAAGPVRATIALPRSGDARIEVMDVAGRRVIERAFEALGAGRHEIALPEAARLDPGVYVVRLTSDGESASVRMAIAR